MDEKNKYEALADYSRYSDELTEVVATLDVDAFKVFVKRWKKRGIYPNCFELPEDKILEITIRKLAVNLKDRIRAKIPQETRDEAKSWLLERGYDLEL